MSTEKPVIKINNGASEGIGCAIIILAIWFVCGGGYALIDRVFDRMESLEKAKQVQPAEKGTP